MIVKIGQFELGRGLPRLLQDVMVKMGLIIKGGGRFPDVCPAAPHVIRHKGLEPDDGTELLRREPDVV